MKRVLVLSLVIFGILGISARRWATPAQAGTAQQAATPTITEFTTTVTQVDRAALANHTARVPVAWNTINRPVFANLVFEQVLPDGSAINVELPRVIPWVASSGSGIAAPILPATNSTSITLRVRLVHLLTGMVYSEQRITLAVGDGWRYGGDPGSEPAITSFTTCCPTVTAYQLHSRSARIPVTWRTANRPITANLVFEQILPNGNPVNVELPRSNPWVASWGDGVVVPIWPGETAGAITIRVRLFDLLNGYIYDERDLQLTVSDIPQGDPVIRTFNTSVSAVTATQLANRTARIPVSWAVDNRPPDANLVFEQVLPNGSILNVELPRDIAWVASAGNGVVAPVQPQGADHIVVRVQLVRISGGAVLASSQFTLPITPAAVPTPTLVPTDTPTPSGQITINTFTASPNPVERGGAVTLSWDVTGATSLRITKLSGPQAADSTLRAEQVLRFADSITFQLQANDVNEVNFRLTASNNATGEVVSELLTVQVTCDIQTSLVPGDCPLSQRTVQAAYQPFQNGSMVWMGHEGAIYVLYSNGTFTKFADTWVDGESNTDGETPPAGLTVPRRGFGKVWSTQPGVREALGWAMGDEQGYMTTYELFRVWVAGNSTSWPRFNLPDGTVVKLNTPANTWDTH